MKYVLENDFIKAGIDSCGAELCSLIKNGVEYVWQGEPKFWARNAPVLFPVVGKLKDDEYLYGGNIFKLGQHGFARDMEFNLIESSDDCVRLSLVANEQTLKLFPFLFELQIEYLLKDSLVCVSYTVINNDDKQMLFSIGAHPGFRCPLESGEFFDDYYLEFSEVESIKALLLRDGLVSGDDNKLLNNEKILELSYELFKRDVLILTNLKSTFVTLKNRKTERSVTISFAGFPYLGLWTKLAADFLCIEPWYGVADYLDSNKQLKDKIGLNSLTPNDKFCCSYSIELR